MAAFCRKHLVYYHLSFFWFADLQHYRFTTDGAVVVYDGFNDANHGIYRLHVPLGEHARSLPRYFKFDSLALVLYHYKGCYAQGAWLLLYLEGNTGTHKYDCGVTNRCIKKI